jgi:hypothetical protein
MLPPNRARGPGPTLVRLLLRTPLLALPFALFFWVQKGAAPRLFIYYFLAAFVFALIIGLANWATEHFVLPRFGEVEVADRPSVLRIVGFHGGASLLGTLIAGLILHFTLIPDLLRGPRDIALFAMYTLLFTMLFLGIGMASAFYRRVESRARAEHELRVARNIQGSFLPTSFPAMGAVEVDALNVPSREVSGDFYDVVPDGEGRFLIAIADVAGKGIPAALLSSMLQASLRTQAGSIPSVSAILRNVNTLVYRGTAIEQFATFFLARLDTTTLELTFCNAGHNYPVILKRDGRIATLERGGTVVGILANAIYEEGVVALEPGDRLLLYTDGVSEAASPSGELYGEERLLALLRELPAGLGCKESIARILDEVRRFMGQTEAADDITMVMARVADPVRS